MGCGVSKQVTEVQSSRRQSPVTTTADQTAEPASTKRPDAVEYEQAAASLLPAASSINQAEPSGGDLRESSEKPLIVFVLGGPGTGKGTQCSKILQEYRGGFRHLSTGELLRAETKRGTDLGRKLEVRMKSGALVEDDQVVQLLEREVNESAWFGLAFLLDGFPRTVPQAQQFEERIRPCNLVLFFDCPERVMLERLTARAKTSGRSDDTPKTVKQRIKTFKKETLPLVEFFEAKGILQRVSAEPSAEDIFLQVKAILDKLIRRSSEGDAKAAAAQSSDWRDPQVVDIEKRVYGAS